MHLKSDYTGEEKRKNNGKLRLSFADYWKIGVLILTIIAFGLKLQFNVTAHAEKLSKIEEVPIQIAEIKKDIEYIGEKMDDFIVEQKSINGKFTDKMDAGFKDIIEAIKNNGN